MKHGNQVEWALHAAATLAALEPNQRLSAAALAALYEVPPKYLAKAMQAMSAAGLVTTTPGPRGGYALAKPASQIRLLDIVEAVDGGSRHFNCQQIRRRGPCRAIASKHFSPTCQLADAMWRAEDAWRRELSKVTLADIRQSVARDVSPVILTEMGKWIRKNVVQG